MFKIASCQLEDAGCLEARTPSNKVTLGALTYSILSLIHRTFYEAHQIGLLCCNCPSSVQGDSVLVSSTELDVMMGERRPEIGKVLVLLF